jgi:hypothetical protein
MATSAPNPLDKPPRLPTTDIPPEEVDALWCLIEACRLIMQHTQEFACAIMLFDFCTYHIDQQKDGQQVDELPFEEWRRMAGRDAGMATYHFGMTIVSVSKFVKQYPWLNKSVDLAIVKEAKDMMASSFPGWKRTRHAISHRADFFLDPKKSRQHSIRVSPGVTRTYWNRLQGREFSHSLNGMLSVCEVSQPALDRLIEVRRKFFSAFKQSDA